MAGRMGVPAHGGGIGRLAAVAGVLLLIAAVAGVSAAGDTGPQPATTTTLTVTGSGAVSYTPDQATLSFGAAAFRQTAAGAIAADATAMNAIIAALKRGGAQDVSTNGVSLSIQYSQDQSSILGFNASNSVSGTIGVAKVGSLIDAAVAAGATNINGPSFSTSADTGSFYDKALRQAVADARQQAQTLADAAGVSLVRLLSITPGSNYNVVATPTAAAAPAQTPVLPATQQVSASVTLSFAVTPIGP